MITPKCLYSDNYMYYNAVDFKSIKTSHYLYMYYIICVRMSSVILYLRNKGVKVDLGIPYELWDTPSAEVTQLQREVRHLR